MGSESKVPNVAPEEWEKWALHVLHGGIEGMFGLPVSHKRIALALEMAYKGGIEVGAGRYPLKKIRRKP